MGTAMQGGTAQRNLECVRLTSRGGTCQRGLVQGAYLQRAAVQSLPWAVPSAWSLVPTGALKQKLPTLISLKG